MRRSKRSAAVLSALAVAALAAATVGLSGATFTTQTGNVRVTAEAGTLELQSTRDGQAVVSAAGMRPGETRSGLVTVSHHGSVGGRLSFDVLPGVVDTPSSPALSGVLQVSLAQCATPVLACPGAVQKLPSGATLASLATGAPTLLETTLPGTSRTYRLELIWPGSETDPDLQAATAQATLSFALEAGS